MRFSLVLTIILSLEARSVAEDSVAQQFTALVKEFEQDGEAREYAGRFLALAKRDLQDAAAVDALLWVVNHVRRGRELPQAIDLLAKHHAKSDKLLPICRRLTYRPGLASERLLRTILEKNPLHNIKANACYYLAVYLQRQIGLAETLQAMPDRKPFEQFYGREFTEHLAKLSRKTSIGEIEKLYERISQTFPKAKVGNATMGEIAAKELFAIRNLAVGRVAPNIIGKDLAGKPMKLADFRGKVVLIDFWGHW